MAKEEKKPFHQSMAEWRQFIYNRNSGEFLGRTAKSWGKGQWRERAPGARRRGRTGRRDRLGRPGAPAALGSPGLTGDHEASGGPGTAASAELKIAQA